MPSTRKAKKDEICDDDASDNESTSEATSAKQTTHIATQWLFLMKGE